MVRSLFSTSWHSVAELKPRLSAQAVINRHVYRGKVWYVVQDQTGGKYHRLSPEAYRLVEAMNGEQTVQRLWEVANESGDGDDCSQNEVVDLLVKMHAADLLVVNLTPDSEVLFERFNKKRRETLKRWLLNPMSLKIPLIDPDQFLSRWAHYFSWVFSVTGLLLWLAVVLPALFLAGQHWSVLTNNLSDNILSSSNLLIMAFVFPVIKALHELGHGFAAKVWGGAVHEMGIMFLVFAPIPYVEASSSSAFPSKYKRATVAAAGMLVELFCAAIAMYVWVLSEPGLVRAIAFNVMVVAGISTIIVNGNPLLRYDGYYIFTDLIEMPNLAQRGQKYLTALWDRYVFKSTDVELTYETKSERKWLVCYTPLAWLYRTFVTLSIIFFIAGKFFIFGVLLALWASFTLLVMPIWKAFKHVTSAVSLEKNRRFAILTSVFIVALLSTILFVLPAPLYTKAEGVVWMPEQAILRAEVNGVFDQWLVQPNENVVAGTPLFSLKDEVLRAELLTNQAKLKEVEAKYRAEQFEDATKSAILLRQLEEAKAKVDELEERVNQLTVYAKTNGVFVTMQPQDMMGRHYKQGELIGYVLNRQDLLARVVVLQDDIDLVRTKLSASKLRVSNKIADIHDVQILRQAISGGYDLPSAALSLNGGGVIPTDPSQAEGTKTINRVFVIDVSIPESIAPIHFGERVHVRFDHGTEPIAKQVLRRLRQLFLSRFGV